MNTKFLKKYVWMLLALALPMGFVGCSGGDDDPLKEVETPENGKDDPENEVVAYQSEHPYANFFAYNVLNDVYLWKQDITSALKMWSMTADPEENVLKARYKDNAGEDIDKWTMMTQSYDSMVGGTDGVAVGTYGCNYKLYLKAQNSEEVVAFVTYTYPDSPGAKAGIQRGDVVLQIDGKPLTLSNYMGLYNNSQLTLGIGRYYGNNKYSSVEKTVSMQAVSMYEDPVVLTKVFDCGGKKVGYLVYTSFTFESSLTLYDVCKEFKQQGISELILDLRYNGGGYVFTEEALASMLAPEAEVKNKSIFQTEIWNDDYMAYYKEKGTDLNTYFRTEYKQEHSNKMYNFNTSDANIGLDKIYALVGEGSASASEAIIVGLLPYMDIEIIGQNTHGKYCSGIMWDGKEWYEDVVANYKDNNLDFAVKHPQFADWSKYIKNWGIYVMIATYGDKNGNNPCMPNGLVPDTEAFDLFEETYQLGDERESMLHVALQKAGKTDLEARPSVSRSFVERPSGEAIRINRNPLDGKLIYTSDDIKARIVE